MAWGIVGFVLFAIGIVLTGTRLDDAMRYGWTSAACVDTSTFQCGSELDGLERMLDAPARLLGLRDGASGHLMWLYMWGHAGSLMMGATVCAIDASRGYLRATLRRGQGTTEGSDPVQAASSAQSWKATAGVLQGLMCGVGTRSSSMLARVFTEMTGHTGWPVDVAGEDRLHAEGRWA